MKKTRIVFLCLSIVFAMTGCGNSSVTQAPNSEGAGIGKTESSTVDIIQSTTSLNTSDMFTSRDKEIGYDENSATKITLNNESVTITKEGVYILSGTLADGQIVVDVKDTEKVQLVLNNVAITCKSAAPIYIKSADKVFITLASKSENSLCVSGEYIKDSENTVDGAVFSKSDITFNGTGKLTINASYGHGIVSKDDLAFVGGSYEIAADSHGISANDSVRIAQGSFTITSGKDGIQVDNKEDTSLGYLYIENGDFHVNAQGDGFSASGAVNIADDDINIATGEGSASVTLKSDSMGFGGGMGRQSTTQITTAEQDAVSQKGIKSGASMTLQGGAYQFDTVDDAIHSGGDIVVQNGSYTIKTGDDGIHADRAVVIQDGSFSMPYCYEGIEGLSITVVDGSFDIVSADDGFNAAGGTDSSGYSGKENPFAATDGAFIIINGGKMTVVSDGDSVDSNGTLTINNGTLKLTCNGNGNSAIDSNGTFANNGGEITTNDGSESGNHMMGGGPGGNHPNKAQGPEGFTKRMPPPIASANY